jgi:hypothetical protein
MESKKNRIRKLRKENGHWEDNENTMQRMAIEYFKELYTKDPNLIPNQVLQLVNTCVTEEINEGLCKPFSNDEISDALFQIGPLKAPGMDRFPSRFFQRNWDVLKRDVTTAVKDFFATGVMPEGVNITSIVLNT